MNHFRLPTPLAPGDKIYVAARFERQAEARGVAQELEEHGYTVTSRWLAAEGLMVGDPIKAAAWAEKDLYDLLCADVYLLLSDNVPSRGGKDFEGGVAWARGLKLIIVGPPNHVFHYLANELGRVTRVRDLAEFRFLFLDGEKIDDM
jgi:hypothetical protein